MDELNSVRGGYNMVPAAGSCLGYKHTAASIQNMKDGHTRRGPMSQERREALAVLSRSRSGIPLTTEHRERISEAVRAYCIQRGKVQHSPEIIEKIRKGSLGLKRSPETLQKMAAAQQRRQDRNRSLKDYQNASVISTALS